MLTIASLDARTAMTLADLTSDEPDCDDADPTIYENAPEIVVDGIDKTPWRRCLLRGCGHGRLPAADDTIISDDADCDDPGEDLAEMRTDCDDADASVNPEHRVGR